MIINQGNLDALYTGLRGTFTDAVKAAPVPAAIAALVMETPSSKGTEDYPSGALLGDLEELLDEYSELNLGAFVQSLPNKFFGRKLNVTRAQVEDDNLSLVRSGVLALAAKAATHPYRQVPRLFTQGFTTAWGPDAAMVWSNAHLWPGGQTWDNLDAYPLTHAGWRAVRENLESRIGPDGQSMELTATHLIIGPRLQTRAKQILRDEFLPGGGSNTDRDPDVQIVKWGALTGAYAYCWFVVDASQVRPVVIQNRDAPGLHERSDPKDDPMWNRERIEYKVNRRYGIGIVAPWTVQAVAWTADSTTTTAAA